MELKIGSVVWVKSGHDKLSFQVVINIISDKYKNKCLLLCDGRNHKLEKPKKKNLIHVNLTNTVLDESSMVSDKSIRLALRPFYDNNK